MSSDRVDQLRAKLAGLRGPSRVGPLMELTQELVNRHWQIGPGRPEGLPLLNEAIGTAEEAYGYFDAKAPWRRQMAAQLGTLVGARHLAHGSPEADRVRAIALLEDGLGMPQLPPAVQIMCRLTLGQLYLITSTRALSGVNLASMTAGTALPATAEADVDRAIRCFREVLDGPAVSAEGRHTAESLLTMADALRTIVVALRGGPSMQTINKLMDAVKVFQRFHEEQSARAGRGFGTGVLSLYDAERLAGADPLDRPVMMMDVKPAPPKPRPKPVPMPPADDRVEAMRSRLRDLVAHGFDLFAAIERLLAPGAGRPPVDEVDEVVALATAVIDSGRADRTDNLLYALGLLLRARTAGSPANRPDVDDAADQLLRAAGSSSPVPPDVLRIMHNLAAALDRLQPGAEVTDRLTSTLAGV
jgi:hypothetical protein